MLAALGIVTVKRFRSILSSLRPAGVLPVLLGMGYRAFSVSPVAIPYLADSLTGISVAQAATLATRVCQCRNSAEVRSLLDKP